MKEKVNWDILSLTRFFLAGVVMVQHLHKYSDIGWLKWFSNFGAFEAILGFLLISGFSIGHSIIRNRENYFKRRIQRIYPVYFVSIIYQVVAFGGIASFHAFLMVILNLLFLNQIVTSTSLVGPAWTLALEVALYCLAPLFLKLNKRTIYTLIIVSLCCYIFYNCGSAFMPWKYYSRTSYGLNVLVLAFVWLAGFAFATLPTKRITSIVIAVVFSIHVIMTVTLQVLKRVQDHQISLVIPNDLPAFTGKFLCLLFVFFVVVYNHRIVSFNSITTRIFTLLGNISYPLYLTHVTTYNLLQEANVINPYIKIATALIVSLIVYLVFDFYSKRRSRTYVLKPNTLLTPTYNSQLSKA